MMDHSYFQVSPDDDRNDVAHLLGKGGLDVVPVVANNTLVGVLGSERSPAWSRMKTPKTHSAVARACRWTSLIWRPARGRCGVNVRCGC